MRNKRFSRKDCIWEFGTWGVTLNGVENLKGPFRIVVHWDRLDEPWMEYFARRRPWVNLDDLYMALRCARELRVKWPKLKHLAVLKF